jgi:hypothetical protein
VVGINAESAAVGTVAGLQSAAVFQSPLVAAVQVNVGMTFPSDSRSGWVIRPFCSGIDPA